MGRREYDNNRVLIVDDQAEIHEDFKDILCAADEALSTDGLAAAFIDEERPAAFPSFELLHAATGEEALEIIRTASEGGRPIALAYMDIRMPPGMDGVETIRRIRSFERDIEVVVMTAYTDMPLSRILLDMDLLHKLLYVRKPFSREVIQQLTLSLVAKWNVEREFAEQRLQLAASHRRLEAVLDATGDAMAMYDADARLVFANRPYEALLGADYEELRGMTPEAVEGRFVPCLRPPAIGEADADSGAGGEIVEPAGSEGGTDDRIFHRSKHAVVDGAGNAMGDLVAYRDLSRDIEIERMKVEVVRLRSELEATHSFEGLMGDSPAMRRVYALIGQGAGTDLAVLITGESGTGKELVARSLHNAGPRKAEPFVAINCAALPEGLIESELFGHEKGAFTGADQLRVGAFERADGGTIFLDEIADLRPALQAKLLRVLQEQEIQRLGADSARPVDVRIVAATNRNAQEAVGDGSFREDLYYRLAAFPIEVPPLRRRRDDIPVLAQRFLEESAERAGKAVGGFSAAAMRLLLQYGWPGNVRELKNAVERAVVLETAGVIEAGDLPARLSGSAGGVADAGGAGYAADAGAEAIPTLAQVEREMIARALESCRGNIAAAARALGINRATLYRKLKKIDLEGGD